MWSCLPWIVLLPYSTAMNFKELSTMYQTIFGSLETLWKLSKDFQAPPQLASKAYNTKMSGYKARGRPRKTWIEGVTETLKFFCCLTSHQHASVPQRRICSDNFTCCHTEIEVADQTFHLTQSQYTDTRPTSPSIDPNTPGAWQGSTGVPIFKSLVWLDPQKNPSASGIRTRDLPLSRQTP